MKIIVPGDTPLERLVNLTKRVVAVPKSAIIAQEKKYQRKKRRQKRS